MFDSPYPFDKVGVSSTLAKNPVRKTFYRFNAKHRKYFVTIEEFDFGVAAIKYCDLRDKDSKGAYTKIFNDNDAFRVITTCLHIMLDYWRGNPKTSFAFYAVPRETGNNDLSEKEINIYKKVRFRIYSYAMVNLFSPKDFSKLWDTRNSLYLLLNKTDQKPKNTIRLLGKYLLTHYEMIFEEDS